MSYPLQFELALHKNHLYTKDYLFRYNYRVESPQIHLLRMALNVNIRALRTRLYKSPRRGEGACPLRGRLFVPGFYSCSFKNANSVVLTYVLVSLGTSRTGGLSLNLSQLYLRNSRGPKSDSPNNASPVFQEIYATV